MKMTDESALAVLDDPMHTVSQLKEARDYIASRLDRVSGEPFQRLLGAHLGKHVDSCLLCQTIAERDSMAARLAADQQKGGGEVVALNLADHLRRQAAWSERTFGPGSRAKGVVDHIRKELLEIEADPGDLAEWIDVAILAFDGAWRSGATPEQIVAAMVGKQTRNEGRVWPDWRTADPDKAIEHDRSRDAPQPSIPAPAQQDGKASGREVVLIGYVSEQQLARALHFGDVPVLSRGLAAIPVFAHPPHADQETQG